MSMAVSKIVLAYSGGLDTSVILKWLQEEYQCPVVAFAADLGQDEDWQIPVPGRGLCRRPGPG
jgi:argininosuccinate synthase